jgi:Ring finger domain/RING-type zinc-finger
MSSEPVQPGATPPPTSPPHPPHPSITITFPIVFVTNPPSSNTSSSDAGVQNGLPPEEVHNLFSRFLRSIPFPFASAGQFEPVPNRPPKKHATQSALDTLKPVDVSSLSEGERRCHICMQDFYVKPVGPRSPYIEDVKDEDDQEVYSTTLFHKRLTRGQEVDTEEPAAKEEEAEKPLEMPCGHVFGSTCLKEWLYQSPTCPLCRVEVDSYTDEPQQEPGVQPFEGPFPWPQTPSTEQQEDMEVDPESATDQPQPQSAPQFPHLAFQFIFTTPAPSPPATTPPPRPHPTATTPATVTTTLATPNISRPATSRSIRHHPYARAPTPSPLSAPSITDRPDLFCAQRALGLCSHDISDESLLRLECGHAFHEDCLEGSMLVEGHPLEQEERRCPRCRRWMNILQ